VNLELEARRLAIEWLRPDVDYGMSEEWIRGTWHRSGGPGYDIGLGAVHGNRRFMSDRVIVRRVKHVEVFFNFSLHELYLECKRGQLSLL